MPKIQLKFDHNQKHQITAIESAVKLFEGYSPDQFPTDNFLSLGNVVPNVPETFYEFDSQILIQNLNAIQEKNNQSDRSGAEGSAVDLGLIPHSDRIYYDPQTSTIDPRDPYTPIRFPSFVCDMETGTGKTYVYLRSTIEFKKNYGFTKFIIVVPSVAIFEGVKSSHKNLSGPFSSLYGGEQIALIPYEGEKSMGKIRQFSESPTISILLMTIDSFNSTSNVIFKETDKLQGELLPYQHIQKTRPILILDESQNYKTDKSQAALRTLHPLFALEFSATPPRFNTNIFYRLTPYEALHQGLVKKIQVAGITETAPDDENEILIEEIAHDLRGHLFAKAKTNVVHDGQASLEDIHLKMGDYVFDKTKNENHRDLVVEDIRYLENLVIFDNGKVLSARVLPDSSFKEDVFRAEIRFTIKEHFKRQAELKRQSPPVKVLSLFFIDRVANFTGENPLIKRIFDEEFEKLKQFDEYFKNFSPEDVRKHYFAKKKIDNQLIDEDTPIEDLEKRKEDKEAEKIAYDAIMKSKEKLLAFDGEYGSVSFIFAHSALREGWDNPNVFQICTLNQIHSETSKRQQIGRGMRLCVDSEGTRRTESDINLLTVIANESYEEFCNTLQNEYVNNGETPIAKPGNVFHNDAVRNESVFNKSEFKSFVNKLFQTSSRFFININTPQLISETVAAIEVISIPEAQIITQVGGVNFASLQIQLISLVGNYANIMVSYDDIVDPLKSKIETKLVEVGTVLGRAFRGVDYLNLVKLQEIIKDEFDPSITLSAIGKIYKSQPYKIHLKFNKSSTVEKQIESDLNIHQSIPNFIKRAENSTHLTRRTLIEIFNRLSEKQRNKLNTNPEGFSNIFVSTIRDVLANHIADGIVYELLQNKKETDLDEYFKPIEKLPVGEILSGTHNISLYDKVHAEFGPEKEFVTRYLNNDPQIICYFKFPGKFKIPLPTIIGNYNPDWGVIRQDSSGNKTLELVRETKGGPVETLQYSNESRKIKCAEKYFEKLEVDYKTIWPDVFANWWEERQGDHIIGPLFNK